MESTSPYEQERRNKRDKLRAIGLAPYGGATPGVRPLEATKSLYKAEMGHDQGPVVRVAGRIVLKRDMGKLSFLTLRDDTGDLQVALDRKRLDDPTWEMRSLLDLGDILTVEGPLGTTNKGETTVWAASAAILSKALLPPPAKWEGLEDVELRYRQRSVDLFTNPDVMRTMRLRIRIVDEIRRFMAGKGFLEVETPMMQPQAGGAAARPFITHHKALDIPLYLRIAPELYLKRLLVGGFTKIFEINRNFRNEGISPRHNPEFTMLEAYEAYGSWQTMADLVEEMITTVAQNVLGTLTIEHKNDAGEVYRTIDLTRWERRPMAELVEHFTSLKFAKGPLEESNPFITDLLGGQQGPQFKAKVEQKVGDWDRYGDVWLKLSRSFDNEHFGKISPAEQLQSIYEKVVEPILINPTFVTHIPSVIIPLARKDPEDPYFADAYELAINGVEISPGYSELNDPDVQLEQFRQQVGEKEERQAIDEEFIDALKHGMPPAGGIGVGIDRLVAMLLGAASLRDVILFPLMKPLGQKPAAPPAAPKPQESA